MAIAAERRPIARLDGIGKRFDARLPPVLSDITAQIHGGRVTGLIGADGAGKTTLLRLLMGLLLPDRGEIEVCGLDPRSQPREVHEAVAYMPQRFGLYEDLSVLENLELYADLRAVQVDERADTFERLLAFTGLGAFQDRLVRALSGGMKQKLGIACALVSRPTLLLLDEPSVGVDPIARRELWDMVGQLVEQGIGVVWSTAYLEEAEHCERVLVLHDGRIVFAGEPAQLTQRVRGRTFLLPVDRADRRAILTRALERTDVVDGVAQGRNLRLVFDHIDPGQPFAQPLVPVAPRFEDAFMDLLGDSGRLRSPFAARPSAGHQREIVIEADALTRRFGTFTAADRISFVIKRGEVFGLIGPNGAGKSTTFKMLCGLLRPTSGSARVVGLDLGLAPSQARARLAYMAQRFSLYGDLSVRQNLEFFARVYGLTRAARRAAIDRMVATFALRPHLDVDASTLSHGYQQRLALACAVMHDPDVLFLDEPTSGVDPRTRREFWMHINAMVGNGVTVMVSTHFLDEAEYCDRVALIYRGRVIASGAPDELKQRIRDSGRPDPTLEDAFVALVADDDRTTR